MASLRVGLFQVASHPAVIIADRDHLGNPIDGVDLTSLARTNPAIREGQIRIRKNYIRWSCRRLVELFDWVSQCSDIPDLIVLPECSVPWDCLSVLQGYAKSLNTVVIAGTHTPRRSDNGRKFYQELGADRSDVRNVFNAEPPPPAVMPIITPSEVRLISKGVPSIFEVTDVTKKDRTRVKRSPFRLNHFPGKLLPLICAEALALNNWGKTDPDLTVISSFDRDPTRFNKRIQLLVENKIPVCYVNDARWGGSGVISGVDARATNWWYEPPNNGALPACECYLEVVLDLSSASVEVGVATPRTPAQLARICPIYYSNEPNMFERSASEAARSSDHVKLAGLLSTLRDADDGKSVLNYRRWSMVDSLIRAENLSEAWLACVANHIKLAETPRLQTIQDDLLKIAEAVVDEAFESFPTSGPDDELGRLTRTRQDIKKRVHRLSGPGRNVPPPPTLPIGRDSWLEELRTFANRGPESVFCLTGLPSVGKTTVIAAALAQSVGRFSHLRCVEGCSADFLFETLLTSNNRIPSGVAPRTDFRVEDLRDALAGTKLLWIEDAHFLVEYGSWRTRALELFVEGLLDAARSTQTRVVIETARSIPVESTMAYQVKWRALRGLATDDATAFFDLQLHRVEMPIDAVSQQQKSSLAASVDGHPGLLVLSADVVAQQGANKVINDLKRKRGRLSEAIRGLVAASALSDAETRLLSVLRSSRLPIPVSVLDSIDTTAFDIGQLGSLLRIGFAVRNQSSEVSLSPILQHANIEFAEIEATEKNAFHAHLSQHFADAASDPNRRDYLGLAIEANYHAAHAGLSAPCDTGGILDGLNAAVADEYERQHHGRVIEMLKGVPLEELPEDLKYMLACSLGWEDRYEEAFEIGVALSDKNRSHAPVFAEICKSALRSRRNDEARRAVEFAERYEHDNYVVDQYKGRLAEVKNRIFDAINHYEDSSRKTSRDPWPFFYWARALLRSGQPEKAIDAASRAHDFIEGKQSRSTRNFERALLTIELSAVVQSGDTDAARSIVESLDLSLESSPETVLSVAFVRSRIDMADKTEIEVLQQFEKTVSNIKRTEARKKFVSAKTSLFRGKLYEEFGDLQRAEEEFNRAVRDDSHNVHMKECLMRVLARIARKAKASGEDNAARESASHAAELAKQILRYDVEHAKAIHMQEDMFREFGIDIK